MRDDVKAAGVGLEFASPPVLEKSRKSKNSGQQVFRTSVPILKGGGYVLPPSDKGQEEKMPDGKVRWLRNSGWRGTTYLVAIKGKFESEGADPAGLQLVPSEVQFRALDPATGKEATGAISTTTWNMGLLLQHIPRLSVNSGTSLNPNLSEVVPGMMLSGDEHLVWDWAEEGRKNNFCRGIYCAIKNSDLDPGGFESAMKLKPAVLGRLKAIASGIKEHLARILNPITAGRSAEFGIVAMRYKMEMVALQEEMRALSLKRTQLAYEMDRLLARRDKELKALDKNYQPIRQDAEDELAAMGVIKPVGIRTDAASAAGSQSLDVDF